MRDVDLDLGSLPIRGNDNRPRGVITDPRDVIGSRDRGWIP
ncbi:hypothetical protein [Actinokineospora sp.]